MSKRFSQRSETILLVADDPVVLNTMLQILTAQGYRVLQARTPKTALQLGARHDYQIDLLLTDVTLPGLYGWQLAEFMKLDYPQLQVLYISGACDDDISGLTGTPELVLRKPFRSDELERAVRISLDGASTKVSSSYDRFHT